MLLKTALLLITTVAAVHTQIITPIWCPLLGSYSYTGVCGGGRPYAVTAGSYDTIFTASDGRTLAFKDDKYQELTPAGPGPLRYISDSYPGLPGDIDAAYTVTWPGSAYPYTYFFKKDKYYRFYGSSMEAGYPKNIDAMFPGVPSKLDAAVATMPAGAYGYPQTYFFKGGNVWKYTHYPPYPQVAGPMSIAGNMSPLIPNNLESAFRYNDGYIYFVKDNRYYRWDEINNMISEVPALFHTGIPPPGPLPYPAPAPLPYPAPAPLPYPPPAPLPYPAPAPLPYPAPAPRPVPVVPPPQPYYTQPLPPPPPPPAYYPPQPPPPKVAYSPPSRQNTVG